MLLDPSGRAVTMVDSRRHSSDEGSLSAAAGFDFSSRYSAHSVLLKPKVSMETIGFAAIGLTRPDPRPDVTNRCPPRRGSGTGFDGTRSKSMTQQQCSVQPRVSSTLKFLPAGSRASAAAKIPTEKARAKLRRFGSPCKKRVVLTGPDSPDRFIPSRHFASPPSTPFHVSKPPHQLTPEEKLLRRCAANADPFLPSCPQRSGGYYGVRRQADRGHNLHYSPHFVSDSAAGRNHAGSETSDFRRQISSEAVWNVTGSSAVLGGQPTAVTDGTGGLLSSGTTAPMYVAKFVKKPTETSEQEKFESRVALALDIDLATRLLGTSTDWPLLESMPSPSSSDYERLCPFSWKDNAWRRLEKDHCKFTLLFVLRRNHQKSLSRVVFYT